MKKKSWICIILAVVAALAACWAFIHRRVIRALIRGEEIPPCPHKCCCGKEETELPEDMIETGAPEAEAPETAE
ncbi:MAG: hypothetical protein IKQ10_08755 [Oscillospiraceae bacterium]|nr:hypothetical protein [Oscillospiraceae bacterium]